MAFSGESACNTGTASNAARARRSGNFMARGQRTSRAARLKRGPESSAKLRGPASTDEFLPGLVGHFDLGLPHILKFRDHHAALGRRLLFLPRWAEHHGARQVDNESREG